MASSDTTLWRTTIVKKVIHALYLSVILAAFGWWLDFSMGGKLDDMNGRLDLMHQDIVRLEEKMDRKFEQMNDKMDWRFEQMDEKIDRRFEQMDEKIDRRFEQVDRRFEQVDQRFEQVDQRFDALEKRFLRMELNFGRLNEEQKWLVPTVRQIESDVAELTSGER